MKVEIYCDGSCLANGKALNFGGYGVVVVVNGVFFKDYKEGAKNTTNNRMELSGLLASVRMAKALGHPASIYCDSAYCVGIANTWMYGWAARGWIKPDKKVPENLDLVKELYELLSFSKGIDIIKVKGHADNEFNNRADILAVAASTELRDAK